MPWIPSIIWPLLLVSLPLEIIALTVSFDIRNEIHQSVWWSQWLWQAPVLLNMLIAAGAALLIILGPRFRDFKSEFLSQTRKSGGLMWWLGHVVAYLLFFLLTHLIISGFAQANLAPLWLIAWLSFGLLTLVLLLLTMAPVNYWLNLIRRERMAIAVSIFAGLAAWGAGQMTRLFWEPMSETTFWLSGLMLQFLLPDLIYQPSELILGSEAFQVHVDVNCSGYEGIGLITVFLMIYISLFRDQLKFPAVLLLFPVGAITIYLLNSIRITSLILLGHYISPEIAAGGFHSQAGWMSFIIVALLLIFLAHRIQLFSKQIEKQAPLQHHTEAAALLVPFIVMMMMMVVSQAFTLDLDYLYPLKIAAAGLALWWFRSVYLGYDWSISWVAVLIGVAVFAIWIALEPTPTTPSPVESGLAELSSAAALAWITIRVLGSVLVVPMVEELLFRGYILRKLIAREFERVSLQRFTLLSFLISSLMFGVLHGRWVAGTLAGMGFALAMYHRGRLSDAILAHVVSNLLVAIYVLAFDQWHFW